MKKKPWGYVYLTTNLVNGKMYVGIRKCQNGHVDARYYGSGKLLKRALVKYGRAMFTVKRLAWAYSRKELGEKEKIFIARYRRKFGRDRMYNLADGGYYGVSGLKFTKEQRQRSSRRFITLWANPEFKRRMCVQRTGHKVTRATRKKMALASRGRTLSLEAREKISQAAKGRKMHENTRVAIRLSRVGSRHSAVTKRRMSRAQKAGWSESRRTKMRAHKVAWWASRREAVV